MLTADVDLAAVFDLNYPDVLDGPVPLKLTYQETAATKPHRCLQD